MAVRAARDAHDEVIELARRLKAPVAHTSRAPRIFSNTAIPTTLA